MATSPSSVACARCGAADHRAAHCVRPFLRTLCRHCDRMGHSETSCPQKRREEASARRAEAARREAEWIASGGLERRATLGPRRVLQKFDETASVASDATATTASSTVPRLSEPEEQQARKYEKVLREITKLEGRAGAGERLEPNQLAKINRRTEIEGTLVMQKLRAGHRRFSLG